MNVNVVPTGPRAGFFFAAATAVASGPAMKRSGRTSTFEPCGPLVSAGVVGVWVVVVVVVGVVVVPPPPVVGVGVGGGSTVKRPIFPLVSSVNHMFPSAPLA